ncbi:hypothetical protein ACN38_g11929, partial [Penicillium nordicum]
LGSSENLGSSVAHQHGKVLVGRATIRYYVAIKFSLD